MHPLPPRDSAPSAGTRRLNRAVLVTALSVGLAACSRLAPSNDDLFAPPPAGGSSAGGRPSSGSGTGGTTDAGGGGPGDAGHSSGAVTFAGEGGGGTAGEPAMTAAGAGGAGAAGASGGEAGEGGEGGAAQVCSTACGANEACTATSAGPACTCVDGFIRDGAVCRLPRSCNELHRASPALGSGSYALRPAAATSSFRSYCGMVNEGGGWTLVVNEGPSFDPMTMGVADSCYSSSCTNVAYAQVPLEADVMLDISNSPITSTTYTARVIVTGVHAMSRGKTLRTLFTTGPNYIDAEDNSNVAVRMMGGAECTSLPADMAHLVCDTCTTADCKVPVMAFGDNDSAAGCRETGVPRFAIGGSRDYATAWTNCAGWPQDPNANGTDFYPDYVRVWIR
jgi:hypothetical protein